jgi:hypothetical protein
MSFKKAVCSDFRTPPALAKLQTNKAKSVSECGDIPLEHIIRLVLSDCCVLVLVQLESRVEAEARGHMQTNEIRILKIDKITI